MRALCPDTRRAIFKSARTSQLHDLGPTLKTLKVERQIADPAEVVSRQTLACRHYSLCCHFLVALCERAQCAEVDALAEEVCIPEAYV